jgi:hypothetical protein
MTTTETVETVYGPVDVELVVCDSCEQKIRKQDAHDFQIRRSGHVTRSGHACSACVDEGPISFPDRTWKLNAPHRGVDEINFGILLWPLTALVFITSEDAHEWHRGYSLASVGAYIWIGVMGLIIAFTLL